MTDPKKPFLKTDRGRFITFVAAASILIGGTFSVQAVADSKYGEHIKLAVTDENGINPFTQKASWGSHRRNRGERFANMSEAEIEKMVTRVVRHVSIEIEATDEQEEKIVELVTAVAMDMQPLRKQFRTAGKTFHDLLKAPTIDRNAIEELRAKQMAEADRISRRVTTALIDVAEVLAPEQRQTLDERIEEFRSWGHRRRGHRG